MNDEVTDEVGDLFPLFIKFSEEPPFLLRLQCHAVQRQQKDINAEMNLGDCTMRGTACGGGPQVAALGGCFYSIPNGCLNSVPGSIDWNKALGACPLVESDTISIAER